MIKFIKQLFCNHKYNFLKTESSISKLLNSPPILTKLDMKCIECAKISEFMVVPNLNDHTDKLREAYQKSGQMTLEYYLTKDELNAINQRKESKD